MTVHEIASGVNRITGAPMIFGKDEAGRYYVIINGINVKTSMRREDVEPYFKSMCKNRGKRKHKPLCKFKGRTNMPHQALAAALNKELGIEGEQESYKTEDIAPNIQEGWLTWEKGTWTLWWETYD